MRLFDVGAREEPQEPSSRVLTWPNALSLARLAVLPWLLLDLISGAHLRALVLLMVFAATDWFDGYLARRMDQITRVGQLLDPISDRLMLAVVGIGFAISGLLPWWAVLAVLGRDAILLVVNGVVLLRGRQIPEVTRLGKAATFGLLFALPTLLIASAAGDGPEAPQPALLVIGWVMLLTSLALYWAAGADYLRRLWVERGTVG